MLNKVIDRNGDINRMNYMNLEKNICDAVKEGQIKIGYDEGPVRLYYPIESIGELLEIDDLTVNGMQEILVDFNRVCSERLGMVEISNKEDRFCFMIPKEGTKYINESYKDNPFLRKFIQNITKPNCTLEDMLNVFYIYSKDIYFEENDELGYIVYFNDNTIDEYVYCLKFDEFGATYHRFTKLDYKKLI